MDIRTSERHIKCLSLLEYLHELMAASKISFDLNSFFLYAMYNNQMTKLLGVPKVGLRGKHIKFSNSNRPDLVNASGGK